jgi:hypothetical protein
MCSAMTNLLSAMKMRVTWKQILPAYKEKREEGILSAPFTHNNLFLFEVQILEVCMDVIIRQINNGFEPSRSPLFFNKVYKIVP